MIGVYPGSFLPPGDPDQGKRHLNRAGRNTAYDEIMLCFVFKVLLGLSFAGLLVSLLLLGRGQYTGDVLIVRPWTDWIVEMRAGVGRVDLRHTAPLYESGGTRAWFSAWHRLSATDIAERRWAGRSSAGVSWQNRLVVDFAGIPLSRVRGIQFPTIYLSILFAILPTIWLLLLARRRRLIRRLRCPECGYDMRTSPQRCSECGWVNVEVKA